MPSPFSGQRAAPSRTSSMTDGLGSVPTFTMNRSTGVWCPAFPLQLRLGYAADHSPRPLLRWVSHLHRVAVGPTTRCVRCIPAPIYQVWAGGPLKGVPSLVHVRLHHSVLLARRGGVWWCHSALSLSRLLSPSPALPGSGCLQLQRAAATARWWVLASHPVLWRFVAHDAVSPGVNQLAVVQTPLLPGLELLFPGRPTGLSRPARSLPETPVQVEFGQQLGHRLRTTHEQRQALKALFQLPHPRSSHLDGAPHQRQPPRLAVTVARAGGPSTAQRRS